MMFVLLFMALMQCQSPSVCGGSPTQVFNFEDLDVSNSLGYIALPQPYNNFIIKRINSPYTGYSDNHIPVLNSSNPNIMSEYYGNSATSPPNFILTTGEYLSISKVDGGTFAIISLQMKSIFIDQMPVVVQTLKLGVVTSSTTVTLSTSGPMLVQVDQKQFDQVLVRCVNDDFATCAHISYDDISLCRI